MDESYLYAYNFDLTNHIAHVFASNGYPVQCHWLVLAVSETQLNFDQPPSSPSTISEELSATILGHAVATAAGKLFPNNIPCMWLCMLPRCLSRRSHDSDAPLLDVVSVLPSLRHSLSSSAHRRPDMTLCTACNQAHTDIIAYTLCFIISGKERWSFILAMSEKIYLHGSSWIFRCRTGTGDWVVDRTHDGWHYRDSSTNTCRSLPIVSTAAILE